MEIDEKDMGSELSGDLEGVLLTGSFGNDLAVTFLAHGVDDTGPEHRMLVYNSKSNAGHSFSRLNSRLRSSISI